MVKLVTLIDVNHVIIFQKFGEHLPLDLAIKDTIESSNFISYLDFLKRTTKICDERQFQYPPITNSPFFSQFIMVKFQNVMILMHKRNINQYRFRQSQQIICRKSKDLWIRMVKDYWYLGEYTRIFECWLFNH